MDLDDVRREALHDWLNERPPRERPDPSEYEDEDDLMMGDVPPETIAEAALTPWPPTATLHAMTDIQRGIWHTPPEGMKPTGYFPAQLHIYAQYPDPRIQIKLNDGTTIIQGQLLAAGDESVDVDDGHTTHIVRYDQMGAYLALP